MHTSTPSAFSRTTVLAIGVLAASAISCGNKPTPTPGKEPAPTATPSVAPPAPTASAAAVVKTIPTLVLEKFAPKGSSPSGLYAIEGALMVTEGQRAGRIVDDDIEWIGKIPKGSEALGDNILQSVVGRWPDSVAALHVSSNGRAPTPTWHPLTGKGEPYTAGMGGVGWIRGVARVGDSTLLLEHGLGSDVDIVTVRGPKLVRKMTTDKEAGCKPDELPKYNGDAEVPAVRASTLGSSPEGTLMTIGQLCGRQTPVAEVWDKAGKSRVVDLDRWWKKISYWPKLSKGNGDELFAYSDGFLPVLRYHDGAFEALPYLDRPIQRIFSSPKGQLHAYDGQTIHRYEDGKWIPVARLAEPRALSAIAIEKDTFWAREIGVFKLREGPAVPLEQGCKTWFVYLYQVSDKSEPNYTFPTTRKALSTFPEVSDLGLVDFLDDHRRNLGVTVTSKAQGEAVVAHVKANMKDEDPKLFCYAPGNPRKIDMDAKGK